MKITPDTAATIIVSLASATLAGAGSLVWWVAGLQNKIGNTEKELKEVDKKFQKFEIIQDIEKEKVIKLDKTLSIFEAKLDIILEKLNKLNEK
jgi:hypothetical protein